MFPSVLFLVTTFSLSPPDGARNEYDEETHDMYRKETFASQRHKQELLLFCGGFNCPTREDKSIITAYTKVCGFFRYTLARLTVVFIFQSR